MNLSFCILFMLSSLTYSLSFLELNNAQKRPVKQNRPFLSSGDSVCIIASSGALTSGQESMVHENMKWLHEEYGLESHLGKYVFERHNAFAGTDAEKLEDLKWALSKGNPCKAVFFARGGFGLTHVVDEIVKEVDSSMKFLIGYSDVTHVLLTGYKLGYPIHGPMPGFSDFRIAENARLFDYIMKDRTMDDLTMDSHPLNKKGKGNGLLIGGNLSILVASIGTKNDPLVENNILFIEEVGEDFRHIDRFMRQLARARKLSNLAGLIFGDFTNVVNDAYFPKPFTIQELLMGILEEIGYNYPIAFNGQFGHGNINKALPIGVNATLSVPDHGSHSVLSIH